MKEMKICCNLMFLIELSRRLLYRIVNADGQPQVIQHTGMVWAVDSLRMNVLVFQVRDLVFNNRIEGKFISQTSSRKCSSKYSKNSAWRK